MKISKIVSDNVQALMRSKPNLSSQVKLANKAGVGQRTIGRILSMEGSTTIETIAAVAKAFGVPLSDILTEKPGGYFVSEGSVGYEVPLVRRVPLISWVTAGAWDDPIDNHSVGDAEAWLPCPLECRPEATFALRVMGESMDSGAADGYRDGEIIFVDGSQIEPKHNADVVIKNGDGKVTFKRLIYSGDVWYLKPLNPNWPEKIIELDKHAALVGRVMFSGKSR